MKELLKQIWNRELAITRHRYSIAALLIIFVIGLGYPVIEVFVTMHSEFNLNEYLQLVKGQMEMPQTTTFLKNNFLYIWLTAAVLCILFRYYIIISSYFKTLKLFNPDRFRRDFMVYFTAIIVTISINIFLLAMAGVVFLALGYTFQDGFFAIGGLVKTISLWVETHIPTLLRIPYYPIAILATITLSALPEYLIHRLSHTSRLLWYVFHQPHHAAEILHPMANPPAYLFDFLLALPRGIVFVVIAKLVYTQPLILEGSLFFLLSYFIEIFNHSAVHYTTAYNHKIIRPLCDLTGGGIYHFMHHSSAKEHQMVNLSGGPFCIWDRLFGTFAAPIPNTPAVGLTGNPHLHMNALRILYGGTAKILYELKMNKGLKTRFLILFGSVNYMPPVSKEFLKKSVPNETLFW